MTVYKVTQVYEDGFSGPLDDNIYSGTPDDIREWIRLNRRTMPVEWHIIPVEITEVTPARIDELRRAKQLTEKAAVAMKRALGNSQ